MHSSQLYQTPSLPYQASFPPFIPLSHSLTLPMLYSRLAPNILPLNLMNQRQPEGTENKRFPSFELVNDPTKKIKPSEAPSLEAYNSGSIDERPCKIEAGGLDTDEERHKAFIADMLKEATLKQLNPHVLLRLFQRFSGTASDGSNLSAQPQAIPSEPTPNLQRLPGYLHTNPVPEAQVFRAKDIKCEENPAFMTKCEEDTDESLNVKQENIKVEPTASAEAKTSSVISDNILPPLDLLLSPKKKAGEKRAGKGKGRGRKKASDVRIEIDDYDMEKVEKKSQTEQKGKVKTRRSTRNSGMVEDILEAQIDKNEPRRRNKWQVMLKKKEEEVSTFALNHDFLSSGTQAEEIAVSQGEAEVPLETQEPANVDYEYLLSLTVARNPDHEGCGHDQGDDFVFYSLYEDAGEDNNERRLKPREIQVGKDHQANIPNLQEKGLNGSGRRGWIEPAWNPQTVSKEELEIYYKDLGNVLNCTNVNEEKALKLLKKQHFNRKKVCVNIHKNEKFYTSLLLLPSDAQNIGV